MPKPRTPPFQPINLGGRVHELERRIAGRDNPRQLVACTVCGGRMLDYGQTTHTDCTTQPGERRTAADLTAAMDIAATDAWRNGIEQAQADMAAAAAERAAPNHEPAPDYDDTPDEESLIDWAAGVRHVDTSTWPPCDVCGRPVATRDRRRHFVCEPGYVEWRREQFAPQWTDWTDPTIPQPRNDDPPARGAPSAPYGPRGSGRLSPMPRGGRNDPGAI